MISLASADDGVLNDPTTVARSCSVFCSGPILATVQMADPPLFNDSKTFVDMPLKVDPEEVRSQPRSNNIYLGFRVTDGS